MKRSILAFLIGGVVGGAGAWYYLQSPYEVRIERTGPAGTAGQPADGGGGILEETGEVADAGLELLDLEPAEVRAELAEHGRIVRRTARALGDAVSDAATDARISAEIEAALVADAQLSAMEIDVTTESRRVALSGTAPSPALVGRAVLLAYRTDGVREVVSTIKVEEPRD